MSEQQAEMSLPGNGNSGPKNPLFVRFPCGCLGIEWLDPNAGNTELILWDCSKREFVCILQEPHTLMHKPEPLPFDEAWLLIARLQRLLKDAIITQQLRELAAGATGGLHA